MYKLKHKETGLYFTKCGNRHYRLGKVGTNWTNKVDLKWFEENYTEYAEFGKQGKRFDRKDFVRQKLELLVVGEEEL